MQLDPVAIAAGVRLLALGTVGSTNKEARARAQNGERGPLWITAVAQTEGRGRKDRRWVSPEGNLYASLLLSEPSSLDRAPELAFVAALAARDAIVAEAPTLAPHLGFKWPNDLLLGDGKCAGILIEGEVAQGPDVEPGGALSVVIGIGVNCTSHPPTVAGPDAAAPAGPGAGKALFPATDLRDHGADVTPQQLFRRLSATMCGRVAQWDRGRGFAGILGDWLKAARGVGEDVTIRNGGSEKSGRFVGLDQSGRLVLELRGGGVEKIAAGDVFPLARRGRWRAPRWQG